MVRFLQEALYKEFLLLRAKAALEGGGVMSRRGAGLNPALHYCDT